MEEQNDNHHTLSEKAIEQPMQLQIIQAQIAKFCNQFSATEMLKWADELLGIVQNTRKMVEKRVKR